MKKIIWCVCGLLLLGCQKENVYTPYIELAKTKAVTEEMPFQVSFYVDNVNEEEYIYQVVIDQGTQELQDVQAIVIHDQPTKDIFPSIGIIDEPITLNETQKGINLVGYVLKANDITFRVWIKANGKEYVVEYNYR